jgi:hypothetical protein
MNDEISRWMKRIDIAVMVFTLVVLVGVVGYGAPMVISPQDGLEITSTNVLFEFKEGNKILIDDNLEFSSPEEIFAEDNLVVSLEPGKYYWKIVGAGESEVRELTIKSFVGLKLREKEEGFEVVNAGNVIMDVEVYNKGVFVGNVVLQPEESGEGLGDKFIGGQNE